MKCKVVFQLWIIFIRVIIPTGAARHFFKTNLKKPKTSRTITHTSEYDQHRDLRKFVIASKGGVPKLRLLESTPSIAPTFASMSPSTTSNVMPSLSPSLIPSATPSSAPTSTPTKLRNDESENKKKDEEESLGIFFGLMTLGFLFLGYKARQRRKRQLLLRDRHVISSDPNATNAHLSEFYIDDNELI